MTAAAVAQWYTKAHTTRQLRNCYMPDAATAQEEDVVITVVLQKEQAQMGISTGLDSTADLVLFPHCPITQQSCQCEP
jgi:hypothetical protein